MNTKKRNGFKSRTNGFALRPGYRVIARFGPARLVRQPDGRHELIGGTAEECAEAREWCSLFAPHVVFSPAAPPPGAIVLIA